jgi:glycerophosphoryl diester phosphodiesterase
VSKYLGMQAPFGVAHRGGSLENLENSPSAFRYALELGFKVIETDVQATADGELVVIHDADTKRVSATVVAINAVTWHELSTLKLSNGELLWRLQDLVLATAPEVRLNIDPKSDAAVNPLIEYLKSHPEVSKRVCIGSFSARRLKLCQSSQPVWGPLKWRG